MLKFRLIARLDIRNEYLIKPVRYEGVRRVGDPAEFAERYDVAGVDEILFLDTVASLYGRSSLPHFVARTAERAFVPLTAGGGVRTVDHAGELLRRGADKIAANTAFVGRPALITELAAKFGSQAVTLQLDAKRKGTSWEAYCDGGRQPTGRDAIAWAREVVDRGAGEILATSIDHEGVRAGFDLDLVGEVATLPVPVIASGGFGAPPDAVAAYRAGASGVAVAGALHYGRATINEIRQALSEAGIAVRKVA